MIFIHISICVDTCICRLLTQNHMNAPNPVAVYRYMALGCFTGRMRTRSRWNVLSLTEAYRMEVDWMSGIGILAMSTMAAGHQALQNSGSRQRLPNIKASRKMGAYNRWPHCQKMSINGRERCSRSHLDWEQWRGVALIIGLKRPRQNHGRSAMLRLRLCSGSIIHQLILSDHGRVIRTARRLVNGTQPASFSRASPYPMSSSFMLASSECLPWESSILPTVARRVFQSGRSRHSIHLPSAVLLYKDALWIAIVL